ELKYEPAAVDTSQVMLPEELLDLVERLACNVHNVWARQRMDQGWRHGPERNDARKEHPDLVPYEELSEVEKEYDRSTAMETIKTIVGWGYRIEPPERSSSTTPDTPVAADQEAAAVLQLLEGPDSSKLAPLLALWQGHDPARWAGALPIYQRLAERM